MSIVKSHMCENLPKKTISFYTLEISIKWRKNIIYTLSLIIKGVILNLKNA
jgi:hypothetical protein